jgi:hypothetical protein
MAGACAQVAAEETARLISAFSKVLSGASEELAWRGYAFVEWSQLRSSDPTLDRWRFFSGVLIQY